MGEIVGGDDGDFLGGGSDDFFEKGFFGGLGIEAMDDEKLGGGFGELGGEGEEGEAEDGESGLIALADDEKMIAGLAVEDDFGGAFDGIGGPEPGARGEAGGGGWGGEDGAEEIVFANFGWGVAFEDHGTGVVRRVEGGEFLDLIEPAIAFVIG